MLKRVLRRLRRYLHGDITSVLEANRAELQTLGAHTQALAAELRAMRAEMQAERHAFQQTIEQQREHHQVFIRDHFARLQKLHDGLEVDRLVDALEAAILTTALQRED